jgi:class 3 adenylate cyclase
MNHQIDITPVLPVIRVPALVIHAARDQTLRVENGRYLAEHIRGARYVELDSQDHLPWVMDTDVITSEIEEFLTGERSAGASDRVLATVLFTDIVDSTGVAARLGDRRWREVLEAHTNATRDAVARHKGTVVKSRGDGYLAMFDGPARAIRCARQLCDAMQPLGIEIRAGLHTGECEILSDDIGGIAVHTGARVAELADAGEVLVSSTVRDLVAGSGIEFEERGTHTLKGVPEQWRIFAVTRA